MTMTDEEYESALAHFIPEIKDKMRARDTTMREAVGLVKAQLAAALALISEAKDELRTGPSYGWEDRLASKLGGFLAQAEQQEECAHEFVPFQPACLKCGEPYQAEQQEAPIPEYFQEACDKFDWTPEEALRFYAEGKHFDTDRGRTRILDTGAIASNALKHASLPYLEMKGDAELSELRAAVGAKQEAQGAQARDELAAFKKWFAETGLAESWGQPLEQVLENAGSAYASCCVGSRWHAWQARAALATKPAASEPVGLNCQVNIPKRKCSKNLPYRGFLIVEGWNSCIDEFLAINPHLNLDPPAAAHGDEAVRKDAERYRWLLENQDGMQWENMLRCCDLEGQEAISEFIDAAMRAQGDGGEA